MFHFKNVIFDITKLGSDEIFKSKNPKNIKCNKNFIIKIKYIIFKIT